MDPDAGRASQVMARSLPSFVTGVDVVIRGPAAVFTLRVTGDTVLNVGVGDLHQPGQSGYARQLSVSTGEVTFSFTLYPTQELYNSYLTGAPARLGGITGSQLRLARTAHLLATAHAHALSALFFLFVHAALSCPIFHAVSARLRMPAHAPAPAPAHAPTPVPHIHCSSHRGPKLLPDTPARGKDDHHHPPCSPKP